VRVRKLVIGLIVALVLGIASEARASLITFDEIVPTEAIQSSPLVYQAFLFESDHYHTMGAGPLFKGIAYNGTTHLGYESGRGYPITLRRLDGAPFSLLSLDASEFYAPDSPYRPNANYVLVTGYTHDGVLTHSLDLDGIADGVGGEHDFQHFVLPSSFVGLTSVTFTGLRDNGADGGLALDNIEYTAFEPSSLMLLGIGLLGVPAGRVGRQWRTSRSRVPSSPTERD
jgi:hypothetical protein